RVPPLDPVRTPPGSIALLVQGNHVVVDLVYVPAERSGRRAQGDRVVVGGLEGAVRDFVTRGRSEIDGVAGRKSYIPQGEPLRILRQYPFRILIAILEGHMRRAVDLAVDRYPVSGRADPLTQRSQVEHDGAVVPGVLAHFVRDRVPAGAPRRMPGGGQGVGL